MHFQILFFLSLLTSLFSYEDYAQTEACCIFKGPAFEHVDYVLSQRFNEKLMMEYNSTRGNWTGFTPYAMEVVKYWNADIEDKIMRTFEKEFFCMENRDSVRQQVSLSVAPTIVLKSVRPPAGDHPAILVCTAYNFYPKQIQVTWLRNGRAVTSGVSTSEVMPDGNWYYQVSSNLEYIPRSTDTITCMVEHISLVKPEFYVWKPSLPVPEKTKIALGLFSLMVGLIILSSGFCHYKRKSAAYLAFCQGRVSVPVIEFTTAEESSLTTSTVEMSHPRCLGSV